MQEKNKSLFLVPLRRSAAAFIDMGVVGLISIQVLKLSGKDSEQFNWYLVVAAFMALWVAWDYFLTAIFKTTVGRWIFGVSLTKPDGRRIGLLSTIKSGVVFWIAGIVFGVPWLQVVGLVGNYFYYLKTGVFLWDKLAGIEPKYKWIKARSVIGTTLVLFLGFGLFSNYYGVKPVKNCRHGIILIHDNRICR